MKKLKFRNKDNSDVTIQKGIAIPDRKTHDPHRKYPFENMEVGDSFLYTKKKDRVVQQQAGNSARNWKNASGHAKWKFVARQTDEGIRIWRIK